MRVCVEVTDCDDCPYCEVSEFSDDPVYCCIGGTYDHTRIPDDCPLLKEQA